VNFNSRGYLIIKTYASNMYPPPPSRPVWQEDWGLD
jgi:hypothetical protein